MLSSGVPLREEYLRLEAQPLYGTLFEFSRQFARKCEDGGAASDRYDAKWVSDPFLQWSRRWEYVYVAERLSQWLSGAPRPLRVVDAGSGFTFFPFYLLREYPDLKVDCYDFDPIVGEALQRASEAVGAGPEFRIEDLENLGQPDATIDAVYSVSVIEHTANPGAVIDEIHRILKPGGLFVCTFDISFEKRSPMYIDRVRKLVDHIEHNFELSTDWASIPFDSLSTDPGIVSTRWDSPTIRSALPWRRPLLVWLYDLLRGRPRSSLYRPMTYCCLTMTKPASTGD